MSTLLPPITALGTTWVIEVFEDINKERLDGASGAVQSFLTTFNNSYSRFNSDSLITRLNNDRYLENPPAELIELLTIGQTWYKKTNCTFNILLEEELVRRGYDASYSFEEKVGEDFAPADPTTDLTISPECINLTRGRVDLGGFGKGYAIDRAAELLQSIGLKYFLINGGGDIYATSDNNEPIAVYFEHPTEPGVFLGETTLCNEAFAASSPHKRQWKGVNGNQTHLVNSTGVTTSDATFVKAGTAVEADIIATTSAVSDDAVAGDGFAVARYYLSTHTFIHTFTFSPLKLYT